jgi:hypothetical protein
MQEFERQREALVLKKAKAAEREAREARRIASLPIITNYGRATRSRTKVNYSEVGRSVTTSVVDFHAETDFRCSKTTRSMTMMAARSSTVRGETGMEAIPTLETTVLRLLKPKHQLTAGTLETAARARSRPHTVTLLEERQHQLSVTSMVMPVVRLLSRRTRTRKLCKRTTLPISRTVRTETVARDGIAT